MPFIKKDRREIIDGGGVPTDLQMGDLCYKHYKPMVDAWRKEPRWTTAHRLFREMITNQYPSPDYEVAAELAWQVFFQLHVMPYERQKQAENGDVS